MAKVKLNLQKFSIPEKIQFTRQIVTGMTANANFTTPLPTLASVTTAATALETAFNAAESARDVAKTKTSEQNTKSAALDLLLSQLGNYVENTSGGDEAKITSAGMSTRSKASPIGDLPAPTDMSATEGDKDGEIDLSWNSVKGAKSYVVQMSVDSPTSWEQAGVSTKSKFTVASLVTGKKYWFKTAAVGSAGQGAFSDPAVKVAP